MLGKKKKKQPTEFKTTSGGSLSAAIELLLGLGINSS